MIPLLDLLKAKSLPYIAAFIIAVLTAMMIYIGYLHFQISGLELSVSKKDNQIAQLTVAIKTQNREVQRWKDEADAKQKRAQDALKEAERLGKLADERLKMMRNTDAVTCEQGIQLIDEALGL